MMLPHTADAAPHLGNSTADAAPRLGSSTAADAVPTALGASPHGASGSASSELGRVRPPRHLADLGEGDRAAWLADLGHRPFRARQLSHHYFANLTTDPAAMTDLPAALRAELAATVFPPLLRVAEERRTDRGATVKWLWRIAGGAGVESVLMGYPERVTLCVSCQAGCGMACPFCATGGLGLIRGLSAAEILEQVRLAQVVARRGELGIGPARVTNVVFMGMGEPMVNYQCVIASVRAIAAPPPAGFGLSARNITVSTCGIVPGMDRLAGEGLPVRLALSLHAPDDALRDELVPINRRYPVADVLDAARRYYSATGRRVSIEYAWIRDINDQEWRADLLAAELRRRGAGWVHVNPIGLNPVPGSKWTASRPHVEDRFAARLRASGIPTTIRETRGADIDGACGQLAAAESRDHG
ncbi:MAG: 23S rRNA (adenine(2503)-C(2))-methyltransferase RlmN [Bifidobacteriaceae bacterium]|jgi:23S rRNA (adenine2503-C2)-methyltransferase|nr:23S rRNA (adenine(2503)-C(2))-methyltransferase RlmN [Bifidobacteriaceae bacterium]